MSKKKANHKKVAKSLYNPQEKKFIDLGDLGTTGLIPEFKSDKMDMDGPWGWSFFDISKIQFVFGKIFESQKLTWQQHLQNGSHLCKVFEIHKKAQRRLSEIKQDDLDELYSLRISGANRIWCIKEGNILWILWWDPAHEIYKSIGANN